MTHAWHALGRPLFGLRHEHPGTRARSPWARMWPLFTPEGPEARQSMSDPNPLAPAAAVPPTPTPTTAPPIPPGMAPAPPAPPTNPEAGPDPMDFDPIFEGHKPPGGTEFKLLDILAEQAEIEIEKGRKALTTYGEGKAAYGVVWANKMHRRMKDCVERRDWTRLDRMDEVATSFAEEQRQDAADRIRLEIYGRVRSLMNVAVLAAKAGIPALAL